MKNVITVEVMYDEECISPEYGKFNATIKEHEYTGQMVRGFSDVDCLCKLADVLRILHQYKHINKPAA